ncbi:condensation domain-containing protein [Streptomyces sp. Ag109_O5-1]|uniref:condensation domain-containing protein n=1 Tax=Streptomyces sp. Ag109_O5-1 TaxID=1938851 RepID=UPI000F4F454B|nr:condensation domain-containing protein [Streptomyces sp. Ag109_O5-1]RPE39956.1 condensation domain-containing protein [Streptomyces sp. Ag109_O5-1]
MSDLSDPRNTGSRPQDGTPVPSGPAVVPLTFEQQRYHAKINRAGWVHKNVRISFEISGGLDTSRLVEALDAFVRRHDALHMRLVSGPGGPRGQQAHPPGTDERSVTVQSVRAASAEQFARYASAVLSRDVVTEWADGSRPFALRLLSHGDDRHALLATFQNMVFDGRAHHLFAREVWRDYEALGRGETPPATAPSLAAAAIRQHAGATPERTVRARRDWSRRLAFEAANGWTRPAAAAGTEDGVVRIEFPAETVAPLRRLCERERCSLPQWVVASFARAAARAAGRDRLAVRTTVDTRSTRERDLVGMLAGSAPLALTGLDQRLPDVVDHVRGRLLDALRHQIMTPEDIADCTPEPVAGGPLRDGQQVIVHLRTFEGDYAATRETGPARITTDAYPLVRIGTTQDSALLLNCNAYRDRLFLGLRFDGATVGGPLARSILDAMATDVMNTVARAGAPASPRPDTNSDAEFRPAVPQVR